MKIQKVVERLNDRLYGNLGNHNVYSCFTYETSGTWDVIKFYYEHTGTEIILYNSEDSDKDDNESLISHVLRKFNEFLNNLNSVITFMNNKQ